MYLRLLFALGCLFIPAMLSGTTAAISKNQLRDADTLIQEVDALWAGGDHATIETKLHRALDIRQELLGSDHVLVGDVLGRLGRNAWNKRDYVSAEPLFRRALAIGERAEPESFNTARLLGDLGATLRERRSDKEAETLVRRSVEMRRRLYPPTEPFIASGLDNLARILTAEHRYAEAESVVTESLNIRRDALGPNHEMTRQSEAFLKDLQTVLDPWRIGQQEGWILLVCALGLIVLAGQRVYVERRVAASVPGPTAQPPSDNNIWVELLLYSVVFGCAGAAGYAAYVAADVLVPLYLPELDARNLHKLKVVAAILGFGALFVVDRWVTNLARRACGLSPKFAIEEAEIRHAIFVGRLWVSWPVAILLVGSLGALFYEVLQFSGGDVKGWIVLPIFLAMVVVGIIPAWFWWSIMVPRWQVWAMRRVTNLDGLFAHAIAARLLHPQNTRLGRLCARTELWTPSLWREAQTIVTAARAKPESSADMR